MGYKNIETFILEQIRSENIIGDVKNMEYLGILANINNDNRYLII